MKNKYSDGAAKILEYVGGKENISGLTHCITRLRFALKDNSIVDKEKIEELSIVKGCFVTAGQFQVIIGPKVDAVFEIIQKLGQIEKKSKETIKKEAKQNQHWIQNFVSMFSEIFIPLLPAIIAGGLILGFRNVIDSVALFGPDGKHTLVSLYPFWAQVDSFLWIPGEAIFMFLPVGVCWSTVKRFGGSEILGITLGICLVSPQLMNSYSYGHALLDHKAIPFWNFGSFHIQKVGYQAQVLPALLAGFLLAKFERFLKRITPESITMVVVPFVTIIVIVFMSFLIIGPFSRVIGDGLANFFKFMLMGKFRLIGSALFGFFYAPIVITGLHQTFLAVDFTLIGSPLVHGALLWPMVAISNICQGSAALGVLILNRHNVKVKELAVPSIISAYLGVTEPAMYGINLKYRYGFLAAMCSASVISMFISSNHVISNSIGVGGIPAILAFDFKYWGIYGTAIVMAIILPTILTLLFSKIKRFN